MMKHYKKISSHGSINIPVAMRREMGLQNGDAMEVSGNGEMVTVKPYRPRCVFCGSMDADDVFKGRHICSDCRMELKGGL